MSHDAENAIMKRINDTIQLFLPALFQMLTECWTCLLAGRLNGNPSFPDNYQGTKIEEKARTNAQEGLNVDSPKNKKPLQQVQGFQNISNEIVYFNLNAFLIAATMSNFSQVNNSTFIFFTLPSAPVKLFSTISFLRPMCP